MATLIDIGVVIALIVFVFRVPLISGANWANVLVAIAVALLYEPVFSAYLVTLGQALMGTRVRQAESLKRMSLGSAYKRFAAKYIISVIGGTSAPAARGAASVSVWPNGDHRAIHDLEAGTVVVNANVA